MNNYVHVKTADLYRPNARLTQERQGYQVLTPFGKLGYSQKISDYLMRPIREREQTTDKEHGELAEKYSAARSPQISQTPPPQQPPQSHDREAGISR